jgi:hypothetical protein
MVYFQGITPACDFGIAARVLAVVARVSGALAWILPSFDTKLTARVQISADESA